MSEIKTLEDTPAANTETTNEPPPASGKRRFPFAAIPIVILLIAAGTLVWYFVFRQRATPANLIQVSGRIESDDEFRLVNGFVSDVEPDHLSPEARAKANALLGAYESDR